MGKIGYLLHWPGMKVEDFVSGEVMNWVALVGVPLILWFLAWVTIWFLVEKIKTRETPNQCV
jgi:hypothetical protein